MRCLAHKGESLPLNGEKTFRIGTLAEKTGVTVRTVRYWESLGLLKTQDRSDGGQRYYNDADVVYIKRILQLKRLGFSLDEISKIIRMGSDDAPGQTLRIELLKQYRNQISIVAHRNQKLERLKEELAWHVRQLETVKEAFQHCPGKACHDCLFKNRCDFYQEIPLIE